MDDIRIFVETVLNALGLQGASVPVVRHLLLVVIAVFLTLLSGWLCRKLLVPFALRITKKTPSQWDDVLFDEKVLLTACSIVPAVVLWELLPMVFYQFPIVREMLTRLTAVYIVINSTRLIVQTVNRISLLGGDNGSSKKQYIKSFVGVLRIIVIFIAVIIVIAVLINKSPMSLFAGLGATSAILMLVFKDTIEGLVAGIRLTSNEMVSVGDWITVPGTPVDGNVIDITLTTVKVQQFDNTITTVPPITLVNGAFQNWKGMQDNGNRQVKRKIFFDVKSVKLIDEELRRNLLEKQLANPEQLKESTVNIGLFRSYLEAYLRKRTDVNSNMTLMARQLEATQSGTPIELYFFIGTTDWVSYEASVSDILEHIYAYAREFGLNVYQMFPEQ
ncbi:mechanosensitive ion channel [Prevotella brunnea]|uniref:Mechanosensitive ion channel n=1 Tax=Prevotella brunnea TaxID=2508867 RepID=A0A5C8GME8_9BACT|nr:mechanosensitive ion channel domain-containing protein [Prevotella brunnea]MDR0185884.1 mechanosensitive ion channel [Prevotella brunnea]TXJ63326.1 mechanosensitive ion channel [Prevotella brunnea]